MISLSASPACGPRFLAGWASWLSSRACQCGPKAWQKSSNWQKSSTSRSNIDASPHLMAPTQKEEFKDDKGLASPQTRNSGYSSTLTDWRRQRDAGAFAALKPLRRGPKPVLAQPAADLDQLRRENARLRQRLQHAEAIIGIQKKVAALLGMPMATTEHDETP